MESWMAYHEYESSAAEDQTCIRKHCTLNLPKLKGSTVCMVREARRRVNPGQVSQSVRLIQRIIVEPIRGRWFATSEDIANVMRQQVTRFTQGAANAEADGTQQLSHRWPHVVTLAGDYIEG
ncbi:hypothetical protein TNCV_2253161 [Trichonephila clavipes]|nr:hypothetical protein TNCV_2253161 [Trichonephila clavipes]